VADGRIELDLAHTDPQLRAAFNFPSMGTPHAWLFTRLAQFVLTHDKTIPKNYGIYRHFSLSNATGTILSAEFPDAVGVRHAAANRFNDAVHGAILKAAPELMSAPTSGLIVPIVLATEDPEGGAPSITVIEPMVGGRGAYVGHDGVDGRDNGAANLSNHPLETIEAEAAVLVRRYDCRTDSGGAGRWRGGVGQVLSFEITADGCTLFARGMDRSRFMPWGYGGGSAAAALKVMLNEGRPGERQLGKIDALPLAKCDVVTFYMPGGSGYGDPFERDAQAVARDVKCGFVSRDGAERDYRVVLLDDGSVDTQATGRLRGTRAASAPPADFDFGPDRAAWDAVFDDETMMEINAYLQGLPKGLRLRRRSEIFLGVAT
ncbi:hydantoinase B/oxoprolinase family protein, partial [Rhizobiaceae sp. 2RAB30]